jgi:hypothetical protein
MNHRRRTFIYAGTALVAAWLIAGTAVWLARASKMTAAKVAARVQQLELSRLSAEQRAAALRELAAKLNALSYEERRKARLAGGWERLFGEMSEVEKTEFLEATLPSGVKRMLTAFEELPADKRRRAISEASRELQRARETLETDGESAWAVATNRPPPLSEELQKRAVKLGLRTFYSESSAQAKAELAPLLEEMQRNMESGRLFRVPRGEAGAGEGPLR